MNDNATATIDEEGTMTTPDPAQEQAKDVDATQVLLNSLGGVSGIIYTAIPVVAFVTANALVALPAAIGIAVAVALVITVVRMRRGEPISQAIGGLIGVVAAGVVAAWTGSGSGYFLIGIWTSLGGAVIMLASVLARRPLTGILWSALHGNRFRWRAERTVLRAHDVATLTFAVLFGARYIVQDWLYDTDATGWLAFAKIAMGTPLFALSVLVTVWAFRRSTKHLAEPARV
ncbi:MULTISPECIES: DUF3159 domain-containing protein [unclassified Rhodococcus (in: high G+C Gram-positive bacteria)]|uniref:DUF3159 domain-containing protein n=1 Tax=unclassified Rhodococcus (in: high G+C Gram-positive bacteria) TaxID=192944 RepID=UPI001C9B2320|nr:MULTISPECIES: DUF3159 domain-containing protein [unclassified Rhodococcus (in: high G+C Gram-positive bacteria)]